MGWGEDKILVSSASLVISRPADGRDSAYMWATWLSAAYRRPLDFLILNENKKKGKQRGESTDIKLRKVNLICISIRKKLNERKKSKNKKKYF